MDVEKQFELPLDNFDEFKNVCITIYKYILNTISFVVFI